MGLVPNPLCLSIYGLCCHHQLLPISYFDFLFYCYCRCCCYYIWLCNKYKLLLIKTKKDFITLYALILSYQMSFTFYLKERNTFSYFIFEIYTLARFGKILMFPFAKGIFGNFKRKNLVAFGEYSIFKF